MMWSGKVLVSRQTSGRYGGDVRLGDRLVPRHTFYDLTGDNGHPDLHAHFEIRDGRPECVEFRVTAKDGGRGIRSGDVLSANLDNLTRDVFEQLAERIVDDRDGLITSVPIGDERERWSTIGKLEEAISRPGRGVSKIDLQKVADTYRQHIDHSPVLAVAELLGGVSKRTASRRIRQAREAGYLPDTTQGKRKA